MLVASVVASLGSADALMLTVGADVRVSVATVAAAEEAAEEAAGPLAKQLITLNTFVSTFEPAFVCSLQHALAGLIENTSS